MALYRLISLTLLLVAAIQARPRRCIKTCPPNEVWSDCKAGCQKTCEDPNGPKLCTYECVPGCVCAEGYVRNAQGKCVKPSQCPCNKKCPPNEVWSECGAACQKTCEHPNGPEMCIRSCVPGCICAEGYVRNAQGKCVKPSQCPCKCKCGKNEEYRKDGCQPTCDDPNKVCKCGTKKWGCYCKPGFIRHRGKCIPISECPCKCKNEEFKLGGCEPTCEEPNKVCECPVKKWGCYCKPGFVRHHGKCIPLCECPCKCKNEEYKLGGCEPTCEEPYKVCECAVKKWGCYCKPGFVRHHGKCIPLCECPCKCENEEYKLGGCEPTCEEPYKVCECAVKKWGCYCKPGFVRHHGKCIPLCECPCKCENEEYKLGGCEPTCDEPNKVCECPVKKWGCYCKPGFVRHHGKCIPLCECPAKCGENEEYKLGGCEPTCDEPNKVCECPVKKWGCYCKPGFVRQDGKCIPLCECPPCDESVRVKKSINNNRRGRGHRN